jgi:4-hydroxy-4-methyl-2-oxoglutarate aldolase
VNAELARLGAATVYEAAGRQGLVDAEFKQIVPGSRACGPARIARCGQDDNLMAHAVMARLQPGEVLVLTMPEPAPVALLGDLLATQAQVRRAAAVLVDAAVRDSEELAQMGLPVWARWIRSRGATKDVTGELDVPVTVGGAQIRPGDLVVLDADGVTVVAAERAEEVLQASRAREAKEADKRAKLQAGALSYELDGLDARV